MTPPKRRSISRVLRTMNLLVSGLGLLFACLLFAAYDLLTYRNMLLQNLATQAAIIGTNSESALLFDDRQSAVNTLAALAASPDIISAQVYTSAGESFAQFERDAKHPLPPLAPIAAGQEQLEQTAWTTAILTRRIVLDNMPVGFVSVEADLRVVYLRLGRYLLIAVIVLLISLAATALIGGVAQRVISGPIHALADLARNVGSTEFHARVPVEPGTTQELAVLTDAFNDMLGGLQARERWLQDARDELEMRVQQRTEELQATNQDLESFSYSVSHDLRAPLRHVAGFANMLEQHSGPSLDDRGRRYISTIVDSASRMGRLIDDLLAFSRMGRAELTKQPVNLDALVRDARAEVSPPGTAGRAVDWTINPLPTVDADPALLRPAMVNLLSNAVKYSGKRELPRIEVGTEPSTNGEVIVYVRDNGVGFDMEYAHKLFGVFQRLHASNEFSGTGIGLANVRRIIQRHGGRTWAVGQPDAGATFYFSLPEHSQRSTT